MYKSKIKYFGKNAFRNKFYKNKHKSLPKFDCYHHGIIIPLIRTKTSTTVQLLDELPVWDDKKQIHRHTLTDTYKHMLTHTLLNTKLYILNGLLILNYY